MAASLQLQHLDRRGYSIDLYVPEPQEVQAAYFRSKQGQAERPFPHWTKIWPAALAMADFIHQHPELVKGQQVLELAAGLGLPSLVAARFAKTVCCSDYLDEAVAVVRRSAHYLELGNITCRRLDWNHLPADLTTEVLLLSDVNYDPEQFGRLYEVLTHFLQQGTTILLTTPQRLMAKPFIERLLPFCHAQYEMDIALPAELIPISILVLRQDGSSGISATHSPGLVPEQQ